MTRNLQDGWLATKYIVSERRMSISEPEIEADSFLIDSDLILEDMRVFKFLRSSGEKGV